MTIHEGPPRSVGMRRGGRHEIDESASLPMLAGAFALGAAWVFRSVRWAWLMAAPLVPEASYVAVGMLMLRLVAVADDPAHQFPGAACDAAG